MIINGIIKIEIDGIDIKDYPDMVDAYASSGYWIEDGRELTEGELNSINKFYSDLIQEYAREQVFY